MPETLLVDADSREPSRDRFIVPITLFALVLPTLVTVVYFNIMADSPPWMQQAAYAIGKSIQFALPIVWVWLFYRYRLSRRPDKPSSTRGDALFAIGFGIFVCVNLAVAWFGFVNGNPEFSGLVDGVTNKVVGLGIDKFWKFAALGVFYALIHSLLEEYYWRWFVYDMLKRITSVPLANLISSVGFMAHHVVLLSVYFGWDSHWTYICSAGVAIGGVVWAWIYQRTGRLFWAWMSHMIVDAGLFLLGYGMMQEALK